MGGTTGALPLEEKLHVLTINVYPLILIMRGLMAYYERDSINYQEMENHSDQALLMTTRSTHSLLVAGCDYAYITEMLTSKFYKERLIDVTTVNGINYSLETSLRYLLWGNTSQSRTINYIKDYHSKFHYLLDELKQAEEEEATTTSIGKTTGQLKS